MKDFTLVTLLRNYWIERGMSIVLLLAFVLLAYLSFGYPLYFDRLFIITLVALLTLYKANKDLFSIILSVLVVRCLDEVTFLLSDVPYAKLVYYLLASFILFKLRYDFLIRRFIAPIFLLSLFAEFHWHFSNYNPPGIHTYIVLLAINSLLRHFLVIRKHLEFLANIEVNDNSIDFALYKLAGVSNAAVGFLIIEYLIRHLSSFSPMLVYDTYSYVMELVSLGIFYLVVKYVVKSKFNLLA